MRCFAIMMKKMTRKKHKVLPAISAKSAKSVMGVQAVKICYYDEENDSKKAQSAPAISAKTQSLPNLSYGRSSSQEFYISANACGGEM